MARADEGEGGEGQVRSVWKDHNLHVIFGVTLMGIMGTTSITPAFPKIVQELGISSGQVYLLITVYSIPGILLTAIDGALSDRFGRRKILVPSLMLFGIAGGACALVQDFGLLLALRTLELQRFGGHFFATPQLPPSSRVLRSSPGSGNRARNAAASGCRKLLDTRRRHFWRPPGWESAADGRARI